MRTSPYPRIEASKVLPFPPEKAVCLELPESEGPLLYRQVLRYIAKHGEDVQSFRLGGAGLSEGGAGLGWFQLKSHSDRSCIWALHQALGPAVGMQLPRLYHSLVLFAHIDDASAREEARQTLQELCLTARAEATEPERPGVPLWRFEPRSNSWNRLSTRPLRPWDSVVLPPDLQQSLEHDATWFHAEGTRSRYAELGITYHRTYLFSGPPGAGKTSAAVALAGRFGRPLCLLPEPELSDGGLLAALPKAPPRALFLFEDAEVTPEGLRSLLNGLDGVSTPEDVLFILTTNSPEVLEAIPALVRPGRVDLHLRFPPPNACTAASLFQRFFGEEGSASEVSASFQESLPASSMAELQHWLMECDRRGMNVEGCGKLLEEAMSPKRWKHCIQGKT